MKKLIVLLLAFAMVGGAFAQAAPAPALKLSGAMYGGVAYDYTDATATDVVKFDRYYGSVPGAFRFRLNGSYSNENIGAAFRLQSNDFTAPALARAYGWAKFFDGKLTVNVGKLGDYSWATSYNSFGNLDGKTGMQLVAKPIDGLVVGAFVPASTGGDTLENTFADMDIGAAYTVADIAAFAGSVDLKSAGVSPTINFGVNVLAVENLAATFEYQGTEVGDAAGTTYLYETAYYDIDALSVGIEADQTFYADGVTDADFGFYPDVNYDVTETFNAGATCSIYLGGTTGWDVKGYGALAVKNGEMAFGATYTSDSDVGVYTMWTYNF